MQYPGRTYNVSGPTPALAFATRATTAPVPLGRNPRNPLFALPDQPEVAATATLPSSRTRFARGLVLPVAEHPGRHP